MTRTVWRIATDAPTFEADDMTGAGARLTGGRWNEAGVPVVYASTNRALACLETVVHLNAGGLPLNRYLVEIAIPDAVWAAREEVDAAGLVGWNARPASRTSIGFGTQWARSGRSPILVVPSVVVPEEANVLVNPLHPLAASLAARKLRLWTYDPRMAKAT
ncbi:MAG: RES family NAD+ phosphorylase [Janthinobacterium lividum]